MQAKSLLFFSCLAVDQLSYRSLTIFKAFSTEVKSEQNRFVSSANCDSLSSLPKKLMPFDPRVLLGPKTKYSFPTRSFFFFFRVAMTIYGMCFVWASMKLLPFRIIQANSSCTLKVTFIALCNSEWKEINLEASRLQNNIRSIVGNCGTRGSKLNPNYQHRSQGHLRFHFRPPLLIAKINENKQCHWVRSYGIILDKEF